MIKKVSSTMLAMFMITAIALSACASQPTSTGQRTGTGTANQITISEETKLAVGILKLEGTSQAVTAEQAKVLLPLWKAESSLESNSATAPAEMAALTEQIKSSMTAEQMQAIEKLDLSAQNMRTIMSELGIEFGAGAAANGTSSRSNGTSTSGSSSSRRNNNGGGFGGPPPGGGDPAAMGFSGAPNSTAQASGTQRTTVTVRVNPAILKLLISTLTKKTGA